MALYFTVKSSDSSTQKVTFALLQTRLLSLIRGRIQSGEYTERGLARVVGISQPQIHNVLKGARKLRLDVADKLMNKLELNALQLLDMEELEEAFHSFKSARPSQWQHGEESNARSIDLPNSGRLRQLKKPAAAEIRTGQLVRTQTV